MNKIAFEVRHELLRVLSMAYRRTERPGLAVSVEYRVGHDEAVTFVAGQLGFTPIELYRAADIDRGTGS